MPLSAAARFRYTLAAGSTAVVIGAGFLVAGLAQEDTASPGPASVNAPLAAAASPAGAAESDLPTDPAATGPASSGPAGSPSAPASPSPSATSRSATPKASVKKSTSPSASRKASAAAVRTTVAAPTSGTVAERALAHINAARVAEGLKALSLDANLSKAADLHTQLMIEGCGLSHQCSGEAGLGERFSAQKVSWGSAGENIGYGSSGSSAAAMVEAANGLTDSMLAEVPPNDGHRKNLLNKSFTRIGLSIVRDSKGVTWMTQDFVG